MVESSYIWYRVLYMRREGRRQGEGGGGVRREDELVKSKYSTNDEFVKTLFAHP